MYQIDFEIILLLSNKTRNTATLKDCNKKNFYKRVLRNSEKIKWSQRDSMTLLETLRKSKKLEIFQMNSKKKL